MQTVRRPGIFRVRSDYREAGEPPPFLKFLIKKLKKKLFLAALGLRCCVRAFSSCGEWGLLFVAVRGLLIAVASLVEHGL